MGTATSFKWTYCIKKWSKYCNSKTKANLDSVIFGFDNEEKKLKVLLIKKKINPYDKKNSGKQIALPGDLIRLEEGVDESAKRVLFSLTKLNNVFLRQFKTFGDPKRVQSSKDQEVSQKTVGMLINFAKVSNPTQNPTGK